MGYALAVPIIFWYFVIRVWILTGRKIPLIFIGLWIVAVFASLTVIFQTGLRAGL